MRGVLSPNRLYYTFFQPCSNVTHGATWDYLRNIRFAHGATNSVQVF